MIHRFKLIAFIFILFAIPLTVILAQRVQNFINLAAGPTPTINAPPKVGAYYFGWFSPSNFIGADPGSGATSWANKTYNLYRTVAGPGGTFTDPLADQRNLQTDPWAGVRDLYQGLNRPNDLFLTPAEKDKAKLWWEDDPDSYRSYLKPVIGYYDSADPLVLEKQIMQATQNGLSYFNFYWYWSSRTQEEIYGSALNAFLNARNTNDMKFMIGIWEGGGNYTIAKIDIDTVTTLLVDKYISKPNYLKTSDGPTGRPIIQLGAAYGIKDTAGLDNAHRWLPAKDIATTNEFLGELRRKVKAKGIPDPYITYRIEGALADFDDTSPNAFKPAVDAFSCIWHFESPSTENRYTKSSETLSNFFSDTSTKYGKPFMPCAFSNLDERPRLGIQPHLQSVYKETLPDAPQKFKTQLEVVKNWINNQSSEISRFLTIYAWNEWHEGGIIEPNAKNGAVFLNVVQEVFNLQKGTDVCRISGDCVYSPTPTVTPTPTTHPPSPTPTPTRIPTPTPSISLTPTPTPPPGATIANLTIGIDGIGVTPRIPRGGNKDPKNKNRTIEVKIYKAGDNSLVFSNNQVFSFNSSTNRFDTSITLPSSLETGIYNIYSLGNPFLIARYPGSVTITKAQTTTLNSDSFNLITGDINRTTAPLNRLNILDYNVLVSCSVFSTGDARSVCNQNPDYLQSSDLDDDGIVNQDDITLLVIEMTNQSGDTLPGD